MEDQLACSLTSVINCIDDPAVGVAAPEEAPTPFPRARPRGDDAGGGGVARVTVPPLALFPVVVVVVKEAEEVLNFEVEDPNVEHAEPVDMIGVDEVALVVVVCATLDT